MFDQTDFQKIKEVTERFFKKMGLEMEIEIQLPRDLTFPIKIRTEEARILIGEKGKTLMDIQHLLKIILKKSIKKPFYIDVDINNYKRKKIDYLKETARLVADEVSLSKEEKVLDSMSAYERRIIHMELAGRSDVVTESIGREPERKIIIKPRY